MNLSVRFDLKFRTMFLLDVLSEQIFKNVNFSSSCYEFDDYVQQISELNGKYKLSSYSYKFQ